MSENAGPGPGPHDGIGSTRWLDRVVRRLKLRDLALLRTVAECGSMSEAARVLSVSTPVVWRGVADLESVLGVRLFERTTRGVSPTVYGEALLQCATRVFDEMRHGLRNVGHLHDATTGELRICAPEIMMAGVLPQILERFAHTRPRVRVVLLNVDPASYFKPLRERYAELLLGRLPPSLDESDLESERLVEEPFALYCAKDHPLARRRSLTLADLLEEQWVLPAYGSPPGGLIARIFREQGLEPPVPSIETFSPFFSASAVSTSRRLGILPQSVLQFHAARFALAPLRVRLADVRIAVELVTVRGRTLSRLAEQFVTCAREVSASLPCFHAKSALQNLGG